MKWEAGWAS